MGSENEPAKVLLPYLQRADELQKHELLVAYYCRLYAMDRGLQIPQKDRTKTTNAILVSLMNQLEKDKKSLKLGPEDNLYVEGFASNVFAKADKQDRAGRADLNTAKTFYAASIFFEILNQFGEIHPELEQKQKYAVWKAADIRKALKEGRKPVPGPPGGDKDLSVPTSSNTVEDLGQSENVFASHHETGAGVPPQSHENTNYRSFSNISVGHHGTGAEVPYQFHEKDNYQSSANLSARHSEIGSGALSQFHETDNYKSSGNASDSSPSYPAAVPPTFPSYPSSDYHPNDVPTFPPPTNRQDNSSYPQPPYQHQPYQQTESPRPPPQNYSSHEFTPPTSHPNFQSYPGFIDHSLPATPTHPPYYQPPDVSYPQQSAPAPNYQSTAQYSSTSRNEKHAEPTSTSSQTFHYDSNYMPPPEKIVEAHKAARFAVGALAFDDVAVAVDFLQKSLELLTNPSASH